MCRGVVLAGLACLLAVPVCAAPAGQASTVTIRVHNYAGVSEQQVQQAQAQVSDAFARIGIDADWRTTLRPRSATAEPASRALAPVDAHLAVMLISSRMADRLHVPHNIAGYAAADGQTIGRVAFVVADRVEAVAWRGKVPPVQVFAGVMVHELAHLLLPGRQHTATGIMRAHWTPRDFRDLRLHTFADEEVVMIRQSVAALWRGLALRVAD